MATTSSACGCKKNRIEQKQKLALEPDTDDESDTQAP